MRRLPAYRIHKTKNLAYVTLKGRMHYLGRAHSAESWRAYHAVIAAHLAGKPTERPSRSRAAQTAFTVAELAERWYLAERERFGPRHQRTYEAGYASRELVLQHATATVEEFGPRAFKAIRDRMVRNGRSRPYTNRMMNTIRRCIRWGVAEELVPGDRLEALKAVDGLRQLRLIRLRPWGYPKKTASGLKKKSCVVLYGRDTSVNSVSVRMFVRTPEAR